MYDDVPIASVVLLHLHGLHLLLDGLHAAAAANLTDSRYGIAQKNKKQTEENAKVVAAVWGTYLKKSFWSFIFMKYSFCQNTPILTGTNCAKPL